METPGLHCRRIGGLLPSAMQLAHLLTTDHVVADMEATDHWPAIVELVEHLDKRDLLYPETRESALDILKAREEFTSTGIGSGVAIPHAYSDKLDHLVACFGRSRHGISFDAVDSHPVTFVIMFMVPQQGYQEHLQTLAAIAKVFSNPALKDALAAAPDAAAILKLLADHAD